MIDNDLKKYIKEAIERAIKRSSIDSEQNKISDIIDDELNKLPNVTILSDVYDEYDNVNISENPSFVFNFKAMRQNNYDFKFIKKYQEIFIDDMSHFVETTAFRDNSDYKLYVPYDTFHQDRDCFRVYLYSSKRNLAIPVFVEEETRLLNFKEYGINIDFENEICCYISNNQKLIRNIYGQRDYDGSCKIQPLKNMLFWKDLFIDDISESLMLSSDKRTTGCTRNIWIDENRRTTHQARIKFQHNNSTNTNNWATMIIDEQKNYPVINDNGSTIKQKDIELIRSWVHNNKEILLKLFNPDIDYNIDEFLIQYRRIDKHGNVQIEKNEVVLNSNDNYEILEWITKDIFIIIDIDTDKTNILYNGKLLFDDFGTVQYDKTRNIFNVFVNRQRYIVDIKGNIKKK